MNNIVKVMLMMESKRHILNLKMKNGRELTIGSDDLREMMNIVLTEGTSLEAEAAPRVATPSAREEIDAYKDLAVEQQRQIRKLQAKLAEVMEETQEERLRETRQPVGGEVPVAQERPLSPPPRPPQAGARMTRQRLPQASVLDVSPDQMQQNIWDGMNEQEQREWMQKWNPQQ